ncbi:Glycerol-3-phosphate acyltransferase 4 [Bagarius yarrelli]|uniref:Glycerol-3-phosphate acyltransferase 4 n=1 Tax=Bagarius yarrelli TaxID=175774 RepID=A0A556U2V2_BAGYA|nr:Glycerol-3-phosphate acyltransferase 4 [Bagarius yarrelli]
MSSSITKSESKTSLLGPSAQRQRQHPQHLRDTGNEKPEEGARASSRNENARRPQRNQQHEDETARRNQSPNQAQSEKTPRSNDEANQSNSRRGSNQCVNSNPAPARAKTPEGLHPMVKSVFGQDRRRSYKAVAHDEGGASSHTLASQNSTYVHNVLGPACIFLRKGFAESRQAVHIVFTELREAFTEFDKDKDGLLNCKDLGVCMRTMGYMPTEMELIELSQQINMNMGGHVDFEDFVDMMGPKMLAETADMIGMKELRDAFKEFDSNGDGKISSSELREAMKKLLGQQVKRKELEDIVQDIDLNGDGHVDFEAQASETEALNTVQSSVLLSECPLVRVSTMMESYLFPFDGLICMFLGISFTVWFTLLLVFIIVPAVFGVSFGIRRLYMNSLLKIFEWATLRMERGAKEKNQQLYKPYSNGIIAKEPASLEQEIQEVRRVGGAEAEFDMSDIFFFCRRGVESIVDDEVTKRFTAEELQSWNLLTRSNYNYNFHNISTRLTALWGLGMLIRYGILLPLRVTLAFTGVGLLVVLTSLIGLLPNGEIKNFLSEKVHLMCYRICVRALTAIITYHDSENKPKNGGICVANHTSPIDVIILASDGCYAMVGQVHGGLMGMIQRAMVKACPHIWFERSEVKDRHLVAKRLSDHVADKSKLPILIFPEGTCINNTSVMMFKKGSFEIGCTIYPVAIKYDPRFGDAFWNSSKFGMVNYLLHMMSSWAIVCSVWYLPPMNREEGEDAVQFANRVKAAIARKGGLADLLWDGGLKREKVKEVFKEEQQKLYSKVLVGNGEDRSRS